MKQNQSYGQKGEWFEFAIIIDDFFIFGEEVLNDLSTTAAFVFPETSIAVFEVPTTYWQG